MLQRAEGPRRHGPVDIAIAPDCATAYVTSYTHSWTDGTWHDRGGKVTPIDLATGTPGKPILVGGSPSGIAITPDGATAYVTSPDNNTVVPINLATGTPGKPIPAGDDPQAIAINPQGTAAYVVNMNGGNVTVLRLKH
jgi:YVTN family beta-propeller protein